MLRRVLSNQGRSYIVLDENNPVLKWNKFNSKWEIVDVGKRFWPEVKVMIHYKERTLTPDQEDTYNELTLFQ